MFNPDCNIALSHQCILVNVLVDNSFVLHMMHNCIIDNGNEEYDK